MESTILINLIGRSGTGKTTIAKCLSSYGYNVIQSYTTRAPRKEDEWGHTFITNPVEKGNHNPTTLIEYKKDGTNKEYKDLIAYFNSYESGHHYFATDSQVKRNEVNIYVVDVKGAEQVKEYYKNDQTIKVINILLYTDRSQIIKRLKERHEDSTVFDSMKVSEVLEIHSRLLTDDEIFYSIKTDYAIYNMDKNETINSINRIIEKEEPTLMQYLLSKIKNERKRRYNLENKIENLLYEYQK